MERLFDRLFDFYDFLANILPGYLFLWLIQGYLSRVGLAVEWLSMLNESTLRGVILQIVLAYIGGMLLQGASHMVWSWMGRNQDMVTRLMEASHTVNESRRERTQEGVKSLPLNIFRCGTYRSLSPSYKQRLAQTFYNRFALPSSLEPEKTKEALSSGETFGLMYYSLQNRPPILTIQMARYGFYRVLFVIGVLGSIGELLTLIFVPSVDWKTRIFAAIGYLAVAWISFCGYKRRSYESAKMVCDLFLIENEKGSPTV